MRDLGAIVMPAIDIAQIAERVRSAHTALLAAEAAQAAAAKKVESAREEAARRRLELGRVLIDARKAWPARGPRAKGWGDFLREQGIDDEAARRWMALAGYVAEQVSLSSGDEREILARVPTFAEVGIDKRSRKGEPPALAPAASAASLPAPATALPIAEPVAQAAAPPVPLPPLVLTFPAFAPALAPRPRRRKSLRRALGVVLQLSDREQRVLLREVRSRLKGDGAAWLPTTTTREK